MFSNISNIINIIAIFQLFLLAYIVISNNYRDISNRLLFSFLILNSLLLLVSYFYKNEYLYRNDYPLLFFFIRSTFLILGPLVYLYTRSKCFNNFKLIRLDWAHSISFFVIFIFFVLEYYMRSNQTEGSSSASVDTYTFFGFQVFWSFFLLQLLIYIIFSYKVLRQYKTSLKTISSYTENIDFRWLRLLLAVYLLHWFFDALQPIFYLSGISNTDFYTVAGIFSTLSLLVFTTFVVINGLKQSSLFNKIEEKPKYADSPLTEAESKKYLIELINFVETSKPFLDPKLKLIDLSNTLSIPEKQISQLLNQKLGKNFFDFINGYRIDEVKNNLSKNTNGNSKTVLEIAFMSGFNSKTAFNRSFKKFTGKTPSEYKTLLN